MIQILFAFLAGILTIGAPCILPMLPLLLGTTVGYSDKKRPLFITAGFIITFAAVALLFSRFTAIFGLSPQNLRVVSVVLLALFGLFMLWPTPFEKLTQLMGGLINKAGAVSAQTGTSNWRAFLLGMLLGVIWTPCAGPVLGTILTLVATQSDMARASGLLFAYAIGAGVPMLIIAYGGQYVTTRVRSIARYTSRLQQIFGVLIILLAIAIHFQYDTVIQAKLLKFAPGLELKLPEPKSDSNAARDTLQNSPAPEFVGIAEWLNGEAQTIAALKGKVVLVDFWTYSCINCVRTLPNITRWYDTYKDDGFVVIGVHTPEFAFEKDRENVLTAIKRFGINYPVAQDNTFDTWKAYKNRAWPTHYLIDRNGKIVETQVGEGGYAETEARIRDLLGLTPLALKGGVTPDFEKIKTPEIYFGLNRMEYMAEEQRVSRSGALYSLPENLLLNRFAFAGKWKFADESVELTEGKGSMAMRFNASTVYMVAESVEPALVQVLIDGKQVRELQISNSQLYTLFDSGDYRERVIEIRSNTPGLRLFTLTFG